jgi:hypothetical protein
VRRGVRAPTHEEARIDRPRRSRAPRSGARQGTIEGADRWTRRDDDPGLRRRGELDVLLAPRRGGRLVRGGLGDVLPSAVTTRGQPRATLHDHLVGPILRRAPTGRLSVRAARSGDVHASRAEDLGPAGQGWLVHGRSQAKESPGTRGYARAGPRARASRRLGTGSRVVQFRRSLGSRGRRPRRVRLDSVGRSGSRRSRRA